MTFYNAIIIFLLAPLISCSQIAPTKMKNSDYPQSFYINEKLIKTGSLQIHLPKNRPKNMSIMTPSGKWFVIQSIGESIEYIPQDKFNQLNIIEFDISNLKGVTWLEGQKKLESVFIERGEYLIYFADNLETEPENTFSFSGMINY